MMEVIRAGDMSRFRSRAPATVRRAYDTMACWWVLLKARVLRRGQPDPQVDHCLRLKKGARFRLGGGEIRFLDSDE